MGRFVKMLAIAGLLVCAFSFVAVDTAEAGGYDQRILSERRLRLLYMKYLAGGTLHDVIDWSRQYPSRLQTGATLLEAVDRVLDLRGESPPAESARRAALAQAAWWEAVCRIGVE